MLKSRKLEWGLFTLFLIALIVSIIVRLKAGIEYEYFDIIKPATVIQYSGFISFALLLNLNRIYISKLNKNHLRLLMILAFFAVMATFFEVLWSFGYWFSNYELEVISGLPQNSKTLDYTNYTPSNELRSIYLYDQFSLNFSAKKNMLYFMMSVYLMYVVHGVYKEKYRENSLIKKCIDTP